MDEIIEDLSSIRLFFDLILLAGVCFCAFLYFWKSDSTKGDGPSSPQPPNFRDGKSAQVEALTVERKQLCQRLEEQDDALTDLEDELIRRQGRERREVAYRLRYFLIGAASMYFCARIRDWWDMTTLWDDPPEVRAAMLYGSTSQPVPLHDAGDFDRPRSFCACLEAPDAGSLYWTRPTWTTQVDPP